MSPPEPLELYRQMVLIRRFEEKCAEMYALAKIGGFCHLYIGQEAVAVGAISALRPDDYVITSYRDHGHCLARGSDPKRVMAELFGKQTGLCKGKGGSMHLFDVERRFMGGFAIVGTHTALGAGIAFGLKYQKKDQIVICFFGEGAVPAGIFHESLNMAALWKLPVLFVCENNRYGMGTPVERASAMYDIAKAALAYDMRYSTVDGMDVLAVREAVGQISQDVRTHQTPYFLEARTYRFMGHSMSDPAHGHYRTKEEIDEHKQRDPLLLFGRRLTDTGAASSEQLKQIDHEAQRRVQEAVEFADASPPAPADELLTDVLA
ncbi:MAG: pyruvate dehydrogenase (acetyl-transferring) E1 component subunit alpha [Nitrospirota bacterium]